MAVVACSSQYKRKLKSQSLDNIWKIYVIRI